MEIILLENFKMMYNKDLENIFGKIKINTKANLLIIINKDRVNFKDKMEIIIKEIGLKMIFMEMVNL